VARRYIAERRREFSPDLMGYRRGAPLPPPDSQERQTIADQRAERQQFGLNSSRLLIRRLLRDHSKPVEKSWDWIGIPLTALELRTLKFELGFQQSTGLVDSYAEHCAHQDDGGAYFTYHARRPSLFVINVTRDVEPYL